MFDTRRREFVTLLGGAVAAGGARAAADDAGRIVIRRASNEARAEGPGHAPHQSRLRWFGHCRTCAPLGQVNAAAPEEVRNAP